MSVGEKLVEKAWESMEQDLRDKQSCRRDLIVGIIMASVICFGLAVSMIAAANHTGIADAFEGGKMASKMLPRITSDLTDIKVNVARLAGAVDALTMGNRKVMVCDTQEEARARAVKP